jgi:hypothetical protein
VSAAAYRILAVALLLLPTTVVAQQRISPRPGDGGGHLPQHIRDQLWPERELTPVEQQLKHQVVTLGDSLTRIDATGAQIERHFRAGASAGMVRSSARTLATDCARAGRTTGPVIGFASTLTTNDAKWGEPAVRNWRSALAELAQQLDTCRQRAGDVAADSAPPSAEHLVQASQRIGQALVTYRRVEQALIATLRIQISPIKQAR